MGPRSPIQPVAPRLGARALILHPHPVNGLEQRYLPKVCRDVSGLQISERAVANALVRLSERAQPRVARYSVMTTVFATVLGGPFCGVPAPL